MTAHGTTQSAPDAEIRAGGPSLDDVVKLALVGTGRGDFSSPVAGGPLGETLAALTTAPTGAEAKLLAVAAVLSAFEACGRVPEDATADVLPPAAPQDVLPACSPRAAGLLGRLLAMPDAMTKRQLLGEWFDAAAAAGRRVPHVDLPAVLDYGAGHRAVRPLISAVVGERGHWLMVRNPRWQFGVTAEADAAEIWATGKPDQRLAALRRVRAADPAAARRLIESTWKEDGADERAAFTAALSDGLGPDDEPFLEAALNDRSKQVREATVGLLARLATSAFVGRMIRRATPLLAFTPPEKKLLRKSRPATVEVELPTHYDPTWARDGVVEKPADRTGQRQWWARQILGFVPPGHWSTAWKLSPAECVAAAAGDHQDLLTNAWADAATRNPDADWSAALLLTAVKAGRAPPRRDLLDGLQPLDRERILTDALELPGASLDLLSQMFGGGPASPVGARAAAAAATVVERHAASVGGGPGYDYRLPHVLAELSLRVPAASHDELARRWVGPYWESNRGALEQFLQTLQIRRDIQREFAT